MPDGLDFGALPRWCVFTEADVVRRGLDAVGWTADADLAAARLLEPAAGDGAFVTEAARRLIASLASRGAELSWRTLRDRIVAFEIEPAIAAILRSQVASALADTGVPAKLAERLGNAWCREEDFLAADLRRDFTSVVGNPPFRRNGGSTPDACVPFFERSFRLMTGGARMAMLAPLALGSATGARAMRKAVGEDGDVEAIEAYEPSVAFARRVSVRGALFVILRGKGSVKRSGAADTWLAGTDEAREAFNGARLKFGTLEQVGCRIRLGMATGRNSVFVRNAEGLDVEEDLLVPAVSTRDLAAGGVFWRGQFVLDTARPDGTPWAAREKPRLDAYLARHRAELQDRHTVAWGASWRQTHTRLDRRLATSPKVLVAETARPCRVAFDRGGHMPLNSVHAITSDEWQLGALANFLAAGAVGLVANALP